MNTKLTLSLSKAVIERARKYAKKTDTSISQLVENYLKMLTVDEKANMVEEPKARYSSLAKLRGSLKIPANFDEKDARYKALWEKYLKLK